MDQWSVALLDLAELHTTGLFGPDIGGHDGACRDLASSRAIVSIAIGRLRVVAGDARRLIPSDRVLGSWRSMGTVLVRGGVFTPAATTPAALNFTRPLHTFAAACLSWGRPILVITPGPALTGDSLAPLPATGAERVVPGAVSSAPASVMCGHAALERFLGQAACSTPAASIPADAWLAWTANPGGCRCYDRGLRARAGQRAFWRSPPCPCPRLTRAAPLPPRRGRAQHGRDRHGARLVGLAAGDRYMERPRFQLVFRRTFLHRRWFLDPVDPRGAGGTLAEPGGGGPTAEGIDPCWRRLFPHSAAE